MKNLIKHQMKAFSFSCLILVFTALNLFMATSAWAQSAQEFFEQGNAQYNKKNYAEAVASYGRAIQLQPLTLPKAYLNCARAYSMLKNYPAAVQYYAFYGETASDSESDRKFKAEYKAAEKKARNETYVRDHAQTAVLKQLQTTLDANGPFLTRQGNGAVAFYDVLLRAGYAEPELYTLQRKIVKGLTTEIETEVSPVPGQPLPNLDRTGWEYIRNKLTRLKQYPDNQPNASFISAVESLALGWEAYYRADYEAAQSAFDAACASATPLPAAYWGKIMLAFQRGNDDELLSLIAQAEASYEKAEISGMTHIFALLKAQAYRTLGDQEQSLHWLSVMQDALQ